VLGLITCDIVMAGAVVVDGAEVIGPADFEVVDDAVADGFGE